jgi:two-component system cell cycle response regulator DivK
MSDRIKLLLVDDDSRNTFALAAILKVRGYACLTADSMDDAFAHLHDQDDIRLILLDMMMPVMDGYEAIQVLKKDERFRHIPVIAVTAQAMKGDREKCLAAGADDYVAKPIDVDLLLDVIAKHGITD